MPTIQTNNITMAYDLEGTGEPLVLIAGLGYDRWVWHRLVPGLANHFQVLTYDNRDVGGSDVPPGPYSAQLLADDLAGLLAALGITKTAVMGHSMGGYVAQAFALAYPKKLTRLILASTNFGGPHHIPVTPEALAILMDTSSDPATRARNGLAVSCAPGFPEREAAFVETWLAHRATYPISPAGYQAQLGVGLGLMSEEACFEHKLPQVTAPTLVLTGEQDRVVPPGNAALLAAKLPNSQTAVITNAGHLFIFEQVDTAVTLIRQFLHAEAPTEAPMP